MSTPRRLGNLRYGRLGSLRYVARGAVVGRAFGTWRLVAGFQSADMSAHSKRLRADGFSTIGQEMGKCDDDQRDT